MMKLKISTILALSILLLISIKFTESATQSSNHDERTSSSRAVSIYGQGQTSWLMSLLKEFFVDIDWDTIATARDQVERFLHKVDAFWAPLRAILAKPEATSGFAFPGGGGGTKEAGRLYWSKLFGGASASASGANPTSFDDSTDVKAMLEKIACFVGYMRLLTQTNAALADLDASKVVSNLYSQSKLRFSSSGNNSSSIFSNLFG